MEISNVNPELNKVATPVTPTVEVEDTVKPQVVPVAENSEAAKFSLDDQGTLHDRDAGDAKNRAKGMELSREELEKVVEEVQARLDAIGSNLSMGLAEHRETRVIVAQIKDKSSHELVRQFPSEEILTLRAKLDDLIGVIFDRKA